MSRLILAHELSQQLTQAVHGWMMTTSRANLDLMGLRYIPPKALVMKSPFIGGSFPDFYASVAPQVTLMHENGVTHFAHSGQARAALYKRFGNQVVVYRYVNNRWERD